MRLPCYWYGLLRQGDRSYIRIGKSVYISAWASTLLVQQCRAMRRPQRVGRVTGKFPRFFYFAETEILTRQVSGTPGKMIIYQ